MRSALLQLLLAIDITRLPDRAPYVDGLAYFASLEPESALRKCAIEGIAPLVLSTPELEGVIAETLLFDLDAGVQQACLAALASVPRKRERTVQALLDFARQAPRETRAMLVDLYRGLDREPAQAGLASLLSVWEEPALQACVLDALAPMVLAHRTGHDRARALPRHAARSRAPLARARDSDRQARPGRTSARGDGAGPGAEPEPARAGRRPARSPRIRAGRGRSSRAPGRADRFGSPEAEVDGAPARHAAVGTSSSDVCAIRIRGYAAPPSTGAPHTCASMPT
jgi:hypothetical protein